MPETKQILAYHEPSKMFAGCHFVLLGFDPVRKEELLSRLLEGGGKDAVNYGPDCTHVIVDKLVYDGPICVTARSDGKTLVTGMWVDHSFDVGMPVDPTSVIYRPIKDLNGIPGAQSLIVCLTGYQRQDRDDIMTMVGLMGANFSKPLVANKVTHLLCYKFEGEKYELAKKIKKIKLVNHCWLEHCLKTWKILPEADYYKSGYELEMEVEAKDSEEETEDVASMIDVGRQNVVSAQITRVQDGNSHQSAFKQEVLRNGLYSSESRSCANIGTVSEGQSIPGKEIYFDKTSPLQESHYTHLEMPSFCGTSSTGKMSSEMPSNVRDDTVISEKVGNVSASDRAKKSPCADVSKSSSKSDFRSTSRKSSLPVSSERTEAMTGSPSVSNVNKLWVTGGTSMPSETHIDGTDFHGVKTPLKGSMLHLNEGQTTTLSEKRKTTVCGGSPQSPGINNVPKTLMESKSAVQKTKVLASGCSADGSRALAGQVSPTTDAHYLGDEASLAPKEALNISNAAILKDRQECSDITPQSSCRRGKKRSFSTNLDGKDLTLSRTKCSFDEVEMHRSDLPSMKPPSPRTNTSRVEKSNGQEDLDFTKLGHANPQVKPLKRKILAKKTLGSRPSFYKGGAPKHEGSIKKAVFQNENIIHSVGAVATEDTDNATITEKVGMLSPTNKDRSQKTEMNNLLEFEEKTTEEDGLLNDENKTPDDKGEPDRVSNKEESAEVEEEPQSGNICPSKRAGMNNAEKQQHAKVTRTKEKVAKFEAKNSAEPEKGTCRKKIELNELIPADDTEEEKITESKKCPLTKSKTNKFKDPRKEAKKTGSCTRLDKKKDVADNENTVQLAGKTKTRPSKKVKSSADVEKENEPVTIRCQSLSNDDSIAAEKVGPEPLKKTLKRSWKADEANPDSAECGQDLEVKTDPAWFILSGHRLQRKEFQQVIRRLKGRVCRDSHHWSYQASHFVVPDPIRRTEKFFAAAASGSWILKTDYLSASNEAGRLLSEEPFEWHEKCLSEDGAINLEAPRKWRLLRERTGHGAFYGMRIIIYGECIAPPLDTLKRVVKAGDGTILATSPPYTRFLQSRIDFAIVSPGMPRVDMWVQEFLRHEVPCVVADYLVEYVCKPGYSLERHVQYNTHSWAKKSLDNLINQVEEDVRTPEDQSTDVACQVCQSRDRGEEMLICGDDSGTFGCGVGTHIDCLDPPLTDVPEEDWFCTASCEKREI